MTTKLNKSDAAQPAVLLIDEAAAYLRISPWTLYRKAKRGVVPAFKVGSQWRFRFIELQQYASSDRKGARR